MFVLCSINTSNAHNVRPGWGLIQHWLCCNIRTTKAVHHNLTTRVHADCGEALSLPLLHFSPDKHW